MARKPWSELSDAYRRRLIRAGVSPFDERPGSRQRARGHGKGKEHVGRVGRLSSSDRAFMARVRKRFAEKQVSAEKFAETRRVFTAMRPAERETIKLRQREMAAHYRDAQRRNRRRKGFEYAGGKPAEYKNPNFQDYRSELRRQFREQISREGGGGFAGAGGGGEDEEDYYEDIDYLRDELEDQDFEDLMDYGDDISDFDDPFFILLGYH